MKNDNNNILSLKISFDVRRSAWIFGQGKTANGHLLVRCPGHWEEEFPMLTETGQLYKINFIFSSKPNQGRDDVVKYESPKYWTYLKKDSQ